MCWCFSLFNPKKPAEDPFERQDERNRLDLRGRAGDAAPGSVLVLFSEQEAFDLKTDCIITGCS